jgi:hypothetical protein
MNNYSDPNAVWRRTGYDPYKGMTEDEMTKVGAYRGGSLRGNNNTCFSYLYNIELNC